MPQFMHDLADENSEEHERQVAHGHSDTWDLRYADQTLTMTKSYGPRTRGRTPKLELAVELDGSAGIYSRFASEGVGGAAPVLIREAKVARSKPQVVHRSRPSAVSAPKQQAAVPKS